MQIAKFWAHCVTFGVGVCVGFGYAKYWVVYEQPWISSVYSGKPSFPLREGDGQFEVKPSYLKSVTPASLKLASTWFQNISEAQQWLDLKKPDESLVQMWKNYTGFYGFHRWLNYAGHYQMHLPGPNFFRVRGDKVRMLEIGVQSGGSVAAWKQFYTDTLYYVGLDINPLCNRSRDDGNDIFVEIGSQMDTSFLDTVCKKHGPFDVIIDDGGHTTQMIEITLTHMLRNPRCLKQQGGSYVVEDTHVMTMCRTGYCNNPEEISNIFGEVWKKMHWPYRGGMGPVSVNMYRAIVFIQVGRQEQEIEVRRGESFFKNTEKKVNSKDAYRPGNWGNWRESLNL